MQWSVPTSPDVLVFSYATVDHACGIFWKALGTGMLDLMFPGVCHANTQTQIHKYSVCTNTVNDEMSVNLMKGYIF